MSILGFIEATAVFTTQDYLKTCGNTQANRNLLSRAVKTDKVKRIKRGLYASNTGKYLGSIHNKYDIIKKAAPDAILCYNSAFELFAGQHNLVSQTTFFTNSSLELFKFQDHVYRPFPPPRKPQKIRGYRQVDGTVVMGTTPEQTIVDSLAKPDRSLGVENILRILSTVSTINIKELFLILEEATSPLIARVGWVLEQKKEQWRVSEKHLASLQSSLGAGPFYFTPDHTRAQGSYDNKWKLYFPQSILVMKEWIEG